MGVVALSMLWRLPSLFDPPWVNDEGTYYAIAQAMSHGFKLYAQIWENKPPAIYVIFAVIYHFVGPSVFVIRVLAAGAVLISVTLTAYLGERFRDPPTALLAALAVGLLFGIPFLEGTTANAETLAAPLAAGAVFAGIGHDRWFLAGGLIGLAILLKSVGAFDGAALGVWLLFHRRQALGPYLLALFLVLVVCILMVWRVGVLQPMLHDALLYDFSYVRHANGGSFPWLLALKVSILVALTGWLIRRPFQWLWLLYAVAGAVFGGRLFGHYFLQAIVPGVLCLTPTIERARLPKALGTALASTALLAAAAAVVGRALEDKNHSTILATRLQYYANVVGLASRTLSYADYRARLDDHVNRNLAIVRILRHLPAGRLLMWGNTPWVYPLSGRLPQTAYTSSFRSPEVPGETATLRRAVIYRRPRIVVVITPARPPLAPATLHGYTRVARTGDAIIYTR